MHTNSTSAVFALLLAACASPGTQAPVVQAPAPRRIPNEIRWVRGSAEYRALAVQAYRVAGERVPELARGMAAGTWGVVLDADETVLDNSEYQRRRAAVDSGYSDASWVAWVRERAAGAVPGAAEFTRRVRELGGRVAIVTNRADSLCAATRENLGTAGIAADIVLCQPGRESDKNLRFQRLQGGTAAPDVPALRIVAWVGDNIQDFPTLTQQAVRAGPAATLAEFGRRYFIVPNPMYGSWERNPEP